ncbi:MAG TPA: serine hydrolase [Candidatus Saccharimonadales bacterium]|jgi:CubicO group peptidase (beta-lactamase class C family)|nr:serine hydrolase [Candidatus Saccharimonadales bacterium]
MRLRTRQNALRASSLFASLALALLLWAQAHETASMQEWPVAQSDAVGLDSAALSAVDAAIAGGKYGLVDSLLVVRDGKQAFGRSYSHDYGKIYGELAKHEGPLNHDVNGPYNYFSAEFHPYYQHSDLHTMQSVSKTVTSITIGIAMGRKKFPADLDTPILKYFDDYKVANIDERKRRITLRHLLTMTAGLEWNEDLPYNDPKNSCDVMESKHDWVQYVINQPMAAEPGKVFVYSSGATQLLSHIFKKVTGKNVDEYAAEYLFVPLGIAYHWKHSPTGLPDTEGGLFISSSSLAKIGFLFLKNGAWKGKQIAPADWVKASVAPAISVEDEGRRWKYGFQWWLQPYGKAPERFAWAARGFGGQELRVVPEYDLIVVYTGWDILPSADEPKHDELERVLAAVKGKTP